MRQGVGQRDQPHGRPADVEQLHDRRDGEHRHRPRHPGRDPVGGRHGGVQGTDQDLLGGVRLQRQPDQPRQQVRHQRVPRRRCSTSGANEALDARNFFDPAGRREAHAGPEAVRRDDQRSDHQEQDLLPRQLRGRADRPGGEHASTSCPTPGRSWRAGSRPTIIDPVTGQPFPEQHHPRSRASRASPSWRSGTGGTRPRTSNAPQGNYQLVRTLPQTQDQFTVRLDQDLGRFGRAFGRFTKTQYENTSSGSVTPDIGDILFVQDTKNWQVTHTCPSKSNVVNVLRVGRVEALANQEGIGCAQADVDFLNLTGVFTDIPDAQRGCPGVAMQGYARAGGAVNEYTASNQPMWDISNTTTWVRGNHTLDFGANYRSWWLQRDTAADLLGDFANFNIGFTGQLRRGLPARLLRRRHRLPARAFCLARARRGTPTSSTGCTSLPTSRTTGRSAPS